MKKTVKGLLAASILMGGLGAQTVSASSSAFDNYFKKYHEDLSKNNVTTINSSYHRDIQLVIDNEYLYSYDYTPIMKNNRVLVPLRPISEYMDADIKWDGANKKVTLKHNDKVIELTNGSKYGYVNGAKKTLDESAEIVNGRVVVPIRFVTENLGASVTWNKAYQRVKVIIYKTTGAKYFYTGANGELGPQITKKEADDQLSKGREEGREVIYSYTKTNLTDGTKLINTERWGAYKINNKMFNVAFITQYKTDKASGKFVNTSYRLNAFNYVEDEKSFEATSFNTLNKFDGLKTEEEILNYSGYDALSDLGFAKKN